MHTNHSGWAVSGEGARDDDPSNVRPMSPRDAVLLHFPWLARVQPNPGGPARGSYLFAKRIMDLSLVVLSVPVLLPLLVGCALAIKIESPRGRVFFRQQRTGKDGRRFGMFKFRTMVPDAEERKKELGHLNQLSWPDFKVENDPRVTRVGNFLRRTSLDELPQLLNVVLGQMSLVGPRPTSFGPETYEEWHRARLQVIPGVTGLWQIVGRGSIDFDERVHLDLAYIERQRLSLDIRILFRTVTAVMRTNGTH